MNKGNDNSSRARKTHSNSFTQLLIESDIWFLPFIGKCLQFIGKIIGEKTAIALTLGIILGIIGLYGYTLYYEHLPFRDKFKVPNRAPVLSLTSLTGSPVPKVLYKNVGETLTFIAKATDEDDNLIKDVPYSLKDPNDSGMIIDKKMGTVEWTMRSDGPYEITVIAKDEYDAADYKSFTVTDQKNITISGCVKIKEGKDTITFSEPFEVGILKNRGGPFNRDLEEKVGKFSIKKVPFSENYDIVAWNKDKNIYIVYYGVEVKRDGDEYCLPGDMEFSEIKEKK